MIKQPLTEQEIKVLRVLAIAWNQFINLPVFHDDDVDEFRHAIHQAQNIVLARPALRHQDYINHLRELLSDQPKAE